MCIKFNFNQKDQEQKIETLRDFESFSDLEAWFDLHKELRMPSPNMCDDYSRETRELARLDGYWCTPHLVADGIVYVEQVFDKGMWHVGNIAIVEDTQEAYYVDLAFHKLVKVCNFYVGGKY